MDSHDILINEIKAMGFYAFHHDGEDDLVKVSAEHGDDAADYWGEYRGGWPWINPILIEYAEKKNCFWEWQNPGCIAMYNF